jgi:outer membrane immunogenic protein
MTCRSDSVLERNCRRHPARARRRGASRHVGIAAGLLLAVAAGQARAADWLDDTLRGSFSSPGYVRWDGLHLGAQIGLSNMNTNFGDSTSDQIAYVLRNTTLENEQSPSSWTTLPANTSSGRSYGAFLGYNWQWGEMVVGLDGAYTRFSSLQTSASDSLTRVVTLSDNTTDSVTIDAQSSLKLVDYATLRARAGYAIGQFLPYAVLGVAVGRFSYSRNSTVTVDQTPLGGATQHIVLPTQTDSKDNAISAGPLIGLGVDVAVLPNVFLRAEWEYAAFGRVGDMRATNNTGRVGLGVRF